MERAVSPLSTTKRSKLMAGAKLRRLDAATEVLVNDKTCALTTPPQAMAVGGEYVWISTADGGMEVRQSRTAEIVQRFEGTAPKEKKTFRRLTAVAQLPTTVVKTIATFTTKEQVPMVWLGLTNGAIEVFHGESLQHVETLKKHAAAVLCLAHFGGLMYSSGADRQIVQWRADQRRILRVFSSVGGHEAAVECLFAEGNALVSGAQDCTVKVWDIGQGQMQLSGYFHANAGGVSAVCRVGELAWSGDHVGQVVRWSLLTCEAVEVLRPHTDRINALRRIGRRVYSASADGLVGVFEASSGTLLQMVRDQSKGWITTVVSPTELTRFVIWSAGSDKVVRCWYQDELATHTDDYAALNEADWYLSGSTPYREFRQALGRRNAHMRDQLAHSARANDRAMELMKHCAKTSATTAGEANKQVGRLEDQLRHTADRYRQAEQRYLEQREAAGAIERDLATMMRLVEAAELELNAMSPGIAATIPGPSPGAIPATAGTSAIAAAVPLSSLVAALPGGLSGQTGVGPALPLPTTTAGAAVGGVSALPPGVLPTTSGAGAALPAGGMALPLPTGVPAAGVIPLPPPAGVSLPTTAATGGVPLPSYTGMVPSGAGAPLSLPGGVPLPTSVAAGVPLPPSGGVPLPPSGIPLPGSAGAIPLPPPVGAGVVPPASYGTALPPPAGVSLPTTASGVPLPTSIAPLPTSGVPLPPTSAVPLPTSSGVPPLPTSGVPPMPGATALPLPPSAAVPLPPSTGVPLPSSLPTYSAVPPTSAALGPLSATLSAAVPLPPPPAAGYPTLPTNSAPTGVAGTAVGVGAAAAGYGVGAATVPPLPPAASVVAAGISATPPTKTAAEVAAEAVAQAAKLVAEQRTACMDKVWDGVQWTNPNVGNYIQRRYYGATPSLRTPDIAKRERQRLRTPCVKVEPLTRESSPPKKQQPTTTTTTTAKK